MGSRLHVRGLAPNVTDDHLQLYFERMGSTLQVHRTAVQGEVIVEFTNPAVVPAILSQNHTIGGRRVTVTPEMTAPRGSDSSRGAAPRRQSSPQTHTVLVRNLAPETSRETLELYLESRRSGGGPLSDLKYTEGSCVAMVTFADEKDLANVLNRQHKLDSHVLDVSRASEEQSRQPHPSSSTALEDLRTVSVRGVPATTSLETLELYFENHRRSGGGEVKRTVLDEQSGFFFITFCNHSDAVRVASRSHTIEGQALEVRLENPPQPYTDRIQLRNLPPLRTGDELMHFVEARTDFLVDSILFSDIEDSAVVIFQSEFDYEQLRIAITSRKLEGRVLQVNPIFQSRTLLVRELPQDSSVSEDMLTNYFENTRRNQGGEVTSVQIDQDRQYALVTFADPEVAQRLSSRQHQILPGRALSVSLYLRCLGVSGGRPELSSVLTPSHAPSDSQNSPSPMKTSQSSLENQQASLKPELQSDSILQETGALGKDGVHTLYKPSHEQARKINVKKGKLQLLKKHKAVMDVATKYPRVEIIFHEENECVEIKGKEEETLDAKLMLQEAVNSFVSLHYSWGSDLHKKLLAIPKARMKLQEMMQELGMGQDEVVEFTPDGFYVCALDMERAQLVQEAAMSTVKRNEVRIPEDSRHVTRQHEWSEIKNDILIKSEEMLVMEETTESLILLGIGSIDMIHNHLLSFLEQNSVRQQFLEMPCAYQELFKHYFNEKINDLQMKHDDFVLDVCNDGIIVSGSPICLEEAKTISDAFNSEISMKRVTYCQPSMNTFLTTSEWHTKKDYILRCIKCLVLDPEELPDIYQESPGQTDSDDVDSDVQGIAAGGEVQPQPGYRGEETDRPREYSSSQRVESFLFFERTRGRVIKVFVGLGQAAVEQADRELRDSYDSTVCSPTIDSPQLDQWDNDSKNELICACRVASVDVRLDVEGGKVTLRGFMENVGRIPWHRIRKDAEEKVAQLQQATLMAQQVQWSCIENSSTEPIAYDLINNLKIENAYRSHAGGTVISKMEGSTLVGYTIDFSTMQQIPEDSKLQNKPQPKVIRKNKITDVELPTTWSSMSGNTTVHIVQLENTSEEYLNVARIFMDSLQKADAIIEKIERVQNVTLYSQYQDQKQLWESLMPQDTNCQRTNLWHGTLSENVDYIFNNGFSRTLCSPENAPYGEGTYFTLTAALCCCEYAEPNLIGQRNVFLCRVLVGQYVQGTADMIHPPQMRQGGPRYQSTVDDVQNPQVFVAFNDVQAYPEYRIVFRVD